MQVAVSVVEKLVHDLMVAIQLLGFFEQPPAITCWELRVDGKALKSLGYKAAFTANGNVPVMVLDEYFSLESFEDFEALVHETIHMAQVMKGDLIPGCNDGTMTWKGQRYNKLTFDDSNYFHPDFQPWEAEVNQLVPLVIKKLEEIGLTGR